MKLVCYLFALSFGIYLTHAQERAALIPQLKSVTESIAKSNHAMRTFSFGNEANFYYRGTRSLFGALEKDTIAFHHLMEPDDIAGLTKLIEKFQKENPERFGGFEVEKSPFGRDRLDLNSVIRTNGSSVEKEITQKIKNLDLLYKKLSEWNPNNYGPMPSDEVLGKFRSTELFFTVNQEGLLQFEFPKASDKFKSVTIEPKPHFLAGFSFWIAKSRGYHSVNPPPHNVAFEFFEKNTDFYPLSWSIDRTDEKKNIWELAAQIAIPEESDAREIKAFIAFVGGSAAQAADRCREEKKKAKNAEIK